MIMKFLNLGMKNYPFYQGENSITLDTPEILASNN